MKSWILNLIWRAVAKENLQERMMRDTMRREGTIYNPVSFMKRWAVFLLNKIKDKNKNFVF
jgi:hypothetical protein